MADINCKLCGQRTQGHKNKMYCSRRCICAAFRQRKRSKQPKVFCLQCKVELTGIKRKFCSNECGHRYRVPLFTKEKSCENCNKTFTVHNRSLTKRCCSKECHYKITRQQTRKTEFQRKLKRKNLTEAQLSEMIRQQHNRCAICREVETSRHQGGKIRELAVDHCHETGKLRGLLCSKCNTGLGLFKDDWLLLDNAIEYLGHWHNKHGSSKVQSIQESPVLN